MSIPTYLTSAVADRYAIDREIGRGGMATVYLARDIRHGRAVAIKLLDPELGAIVGVERFLAEIRVTANLQHPNILPLFDSGDANGQPFYVMPYVEGESLRHRLDREKQLPVDEAVRIAVAVAIALDYAHARGVIHRDLKPENILLQHGQPVVADFGIALAVRNAGGARITQTGMSLGTPQYMSPEQAAGDREIDNRSDIYSLAAVTYEMLTGDPPHTGQSAQAVIARVLTEQPRAIRTVRPSVPEHVTAAIDRGLEKLRADRWATARELADALEGRIIAAPRHKEMRPDAAPATRTRSGSPRVRAPFVAGALTLAAVAAGVAIWKWKRVPDEIDGRTVRFAITPANARDEIAPGTQIAISPDGRYIAYTLRTEAGAQPLAIREVGQLSTRFIPGADPAIGPFFSHDGTSVAFFNPGARMLRQVSVLGGPVVDIAEGALFQGTSAAADGAIVASVRDTLMRVQTAGGQFRPIDRTGAAVDGERGQRSPRVLDDGETVLYLSWRGSVQTSRIGVLSLKTGRIDVLDLVGASPVGVVDGNLIYGTSAGAIMAVPFDIESRKMTGAPVQVIDQVDISQGGLVRAAVSRTGSLAYVSAARTSEVVLADMTGRTRLLIGEPRDYSAPRFSPGDGSRLAFAIASSRGSDVWIHDVAANTSTKLTSEGERNSRPEWTPDGKRVLYASSGPGASSLWWRSSDFSGSPELVQRAPEQVNAGVISPDGRTLMYWRSTPTQPVDILYRALEGDTTSHPVAATSAAEISPKFSPDGKWVAYGSNRDGTLQVYVQPFPPTGAPYQVTSTGGMAPVWSPDGSRIFYVSNGRLHAARIRTTPTFAVTARDTLFAGNYLLNVPQHANYDISPDGAHFALLQAAGPNDQIVVAHDWKYELRERMRAAREK